MADEEKVSLEIDAMYLGEGRKENTVNLLVEGKPLFQVDVNDIYPIDGVTEFE